MFVCEDRISEISSFRFSDNFLNGPYFLLCCRYILDPILLLFAHQCTEPFNNFSMSIFLPSEARIKAINCPDRMHLQSPLTSVSVLLVSIVHTESVFYCGKSGFSQ